MDETGARFALPDGAVVRVRPDDIVGRSPHAAARVHDLRVSTVHAELRATSGGLVLLARGGRLFVDGRPVAEVLLRVGLRIGLAAGVEIAVIGVTDGTTPVTVATAGRERIRLVIGRAETEVLLGERPCVTLRGIPMRILVEVAGRPGRVGAWWEVAEAIWSEDGQLRRARVSWTDDDERRLRNRWDHHFGVLRRMISPIRDGQVVRVASGVVSLCLQDGDEILA